jgi:hypothetical protein
MRELIRRGKQLSPNSKTIELTSIGKPGQVRAVGRVHCQDSPHESWNGNVKRLGYTSTGLENRIRGGF